ncbi:hypothetical protein [Ktedonospora formicarum]|uniref:Uncharacterized protein n=1 Tax=Ktedonospora formicarum TaxID=2778364 RepID=A0A8J3HZQ8_9CHLR|nr:hypothetical protein [Ktedonospora formicarum]GHO42904.1 hypothetical protein KSX_10670 [Ktedonospora formicarum]
MSRSCITKCASVFVLGSLCMLFTVFGQASSAHAASLKADHKGKGPISICSTNIVFAVYAPNSTNLTVKVNGSEIEFKKAANCIVKVSAHKHRKHHRMMKKSSDPALRIESTTNPAITQVPMGNLNPAITQVPTGNLNPAITQQAPMGNLNPAITQAPTGNLNPAITQAPMTTQAPITSMNPNTVDSMGSMSQVPQLATSTTMAQ